MVDVFPGILEHSKEAIISRVEQAASHATTIHIDVADDTFVPSTLVTDLAFVKELKDRFPHLSFEAHLMVANPSSYIRPLVNAGFSRLIGHIESSDPRGFLADCTYEDIEVGLAIDGPTELEQLEPFLEEIDVALVMTIEAGESGRPFLPETVEKIRAIHANFPDLPIGVDGHIDNITAKVCREAGAIRLVCNSFLFKAGDMATAIRQLKEG